jgi:hypothetical protein
MINLNFSLLEFLVWLFVPAVVMFIIFEKDGSHIKNRISGWFRNLNPYISVTTYVVVFLVIALIVAIIEKSFNLVNKILIPLVGGDLLLYGFFICFDIFWAFNQVGNLKLKHKRCWIPLLVSGIFALVILTKMFNK